MISSDVKSSTRSHPVSVVTLVSVDVISVQLYHHHKERHVTA